MPLTFNDGTVYDCGNTSRLADPPQAGRPERSTDEIKALVEHVVIACIKEVRPAREQEASTQ